MLGSKSKQLSNQNVLSLRSDPETKNVVLETSKKNSIYKTSLKFATSTAIFSMVAGFNAQLAHADHLDFTLYNESSKTVNNLYVAAARDKVWGKDILGSKVLESGGSTRITFPNQTSESPCIYDVMLIFTDRTKSTGRHNLCKVDSITVR
jgi:spore coat protein U-like protein